MAQARLIGTPTLGGYLQGVVRTGAMLALVCVTLYLLLALANYRHDDPAWSHLVDAETVRNAAGPVGAWFADISLHLFGLLAYAIPVMIALSGYLVFMKGHPADPEARIHRLVVSWLGFFVTLAAGCALASIRLDPTWLELPTSAGGGLGLLIAELLGPSLGYQGTMIVLVALLVGGVSLLSGVTVLAALDALGAGALWAFARVWGGVKSSARRDTPERALIEAQPVESEEPASTEPYICASAFSPPAREKDADIDVSFEDEDDDDDGYELDDASDPLDEELVAPAKKPFEPTVTAPRPAQRAKVVLPPTSSPSRTLPGFEGTMEYPPLDLLDPVRKSGKGYTSEQLETLSRDVETKLKDFGVVVEVVNVLPGPVVTLFELQLAPGTKVSKITGLAKDIARALSTISVRVVEVIPGKSVIGLEIPNKHREVVFLTEVIGSKAYQDAKSALTLCMGMNISGEPVVADLNRMPHALIAGTTGSGKSVAINAMILSLVYKSKPRDVRLIMVDPKMLELSVYEGIPHLLTPVVTDMKEAANALRWCVSEMEQRYRLMAQLGVRNIAGYNRKIAEAAAAGEAIADPLYLTEHGGLAEGDDEVPTLEHLPYIVVIIDELADMMMVVGKKVEELIARLAQKARAAGIHLLLATQRPSVDVLTGLIKANIPTRMAFQVSSRIDSRTVLDQMGAEQLLGYGDMLYLPPGTNIPQRVHGAYVDDQEVHRVVNFLKQFGPPQYIDTILKETSDGVPGLEPETRAGGNDGQDPLYDEAVQIVVETRRASISGIQRRLKIGYNRAARMVEEMERAGLVGPAETNGNREVLIEETVTEED